MNLLDYDTSSDPSHDFTPAVAELLNRGSGVYLPLRLINGAPASYVIAQLDPPDDPHFRCESTAVKIETKDNSKYIFDIADGCSGLWIEGGTWGNNSKGVLRQQRLNNGSLVDATFQNMKISGSITEGMVIGSAAGCMWNGCRFQSYSGFGIKFLMAESGGYANANRIFNTKFQFLNDGVIATQIAGARQKVGLTVQSNWFEQIVNHAVSTYGQVYGAKIDDNYIEACSTTDADILIVDAFADDGTTPVGDMSVMLSNNRFLTPSATQVSRVRISGRAQAVLENNYARISYNAESGLSIPMLLADNKNTGGVDYSVLIKASNSLHYVGAAGHEPADYASGAVRRTAGLSSPGTLTVESSNLTSGF